MKTAKSVMVGAAALLVVGYSLHLLGGAKFPPQDSDSLERFLRRFIPDAQVESSGDVLESHRVRREHAGYENIFTYYFMFSCEQGPARELIGTGNPLDNSVTINAAMMTIDADRSERINIRLADLSGSSTFPDVFYENLNMQGCDSLRIRKGGAPDWYTPERIREGLADRCIWGRGRVLVEFYFDADRDLMFIRIDELRPN